MNSLNSNILSLHFTDKSLTKKILEADKKLKQKLFSNKYLYFQEITYNLINKNIINEQDYFLLSSLALNKPFIINNKKTNRLPNWIDFFAIFKINN